MDVIASTAFRVEIDSQNDPENQFVRMGKKPFEFNLASPKMLISCEWGMDLFNHHFS